MLLPPRVAPIQAVIVPIYYSESDKEQIIKKSKEVEDILSKKKIRVHIDTRDEFTPGYKFHDWEMKGVPLRIEIGPKDLAKGKIVLVRRDNQKKTDISFVDIETGIESTLNEIHQSLFEKAKNLLAEKTRVVIDFEKFKLELEKGLFLSSPWCGDQKCEEKIEETTGADIRVLPFDSKKSDAPCIICKKPSKEMAIFGRGY